MRITILDASSWLGLAAVAMVTSNVCLGLLIALRYSPRENWPHKRVNVFALHNWTAYAALTLILAHPFILLFSPRPHWGFLELSFPLWSPVQPVENTLGAAGLYLVVIVVATSYFRKRLSRRRWKTFHYFAYGAGACIFAHSILSDPQLMNHPIDPFDAEKVFIEGCLFIVLAASCLAAYSRLRKWHRVLKVSPSGPMKRTSPVGSIRE